MHLTLGVFAGLLFDWAVRYGYAAVFVASLFEGTGLPILVEIPFAVAGLLMARGEMSYPCVWLVATIAETLGNLAGYWIGRHGGQAFIDHYGARLHVTERDLATVSHWFDRYGGATIVVARWIGIIRTPTIIAAGLGRMRVGAYTFYSLIAEASWTAGWLWLFYAFGGHWRFILGLIRPHLAWIVTLVVFVIGGAWWWTIRSARH